MLNHRNQDRTVYYLVRAVRIGHFIFKSIIRYFSSGGFVYLRTSSSGTRTTPRPSPPSIHIILFLIVLLAKPTLAQIPNKDINKLIKDLPDEGTNDLVQQLAGTESFDEPIAARLIEISQLRVEYDRLSDQIQKTDSNDAIESDLTESRRSTALQRLLKANRKLIHDFYDHEQRPIWQTDQAEMLLVDWLEIVNHNSAMFVEFGVATTLQHMAFNSTVLEALEATADADRTFSKLQASLPRDPDHIKIRVNTGLWTQMIEEYYEKRTPFFLAQAAYLTTLLPDSHEYYQALDDRKNPKIPNQSERADLEKLRLLELALHRLQRFTDDTTSPEDVRLAAFCLMGRACIAQGQVATGVKFLQKAWEANRNNPNELLSALAHGRLLWNNGNHKEATSLLDNAKNHPLARTNLLYRLLVTDQIHRLLLSTSAEANNRTSALAAAYEPYRALINESEDLRYYIYQRWESITNMQNILLNDLPPTVRMGVGEIARIEGQNMAILANESSDQALRQQAMEKLQRSIDINSTLNEPNVPTDIRARSLFNRAFAQYWLAPHDTNNILQATSILIQLADDLETEPIAEEAIGNSVDLLRTLHESNPGIKSADDAYRRACEVLFKRFPTSSAADSERLSYAAHVLVPSGRFEEAINLFSSVPFDHQDYFESQAQMLFARAEIFRQATGQTKDTERRDLLVETERVEAEATECFRRLPDTPRGMSSRRALGAVRLARADAAMSIGKPDNALKFLEDFETLFQNHSDLMANTYHRRIIALAETAQQAKLVDTAHDMMKRFPDEAAPVIDQVLTDLNHQIDRIGTQAAIKQVAEDRNVQLKKQKQLAATAKALAQLLVGWAQEQDFDSKQMLPFQLIRAKMMRLAGNSTDAMAMLEPLIKTYPNDADLIHHYAESLFATADQKLLLKAATFYDQLIIGLDAPPYLDIWWNAWMRRLQINDQMGQGTEDISLRVDQLRVSDQKLGGPRYREELQRLAEKHGH